MTVNQQMAAARALERLRSGSDARVQADIDRVLDDVRSHDPSARPDWLTGATYALNRYRNAQRGPGEPVANVEGVGSDDAVTEAVARAVGRPVYLVRDNRIDLDSARAEAQAWRQMLEEVGRIAERVFPSVGRIEVENYGGLLGFVGTGWLIDEGLVVTNRHVAQYFAERDGAAFRFRIGFDRVRPMRVRIDYREEYERQGVEEMPIDRIVWMPATDRPDVAFLRLAASAQAPARRAIPLAAVRPAAGALVGVVGYPARDYDFWDRELLSRLFGDIYDKKRFAPGNVLQVSDTDLDHDCTTLGGNSGSALIDLGTGEAVGLHYAGVPLVENRAVPAAVVAEARRRALSSQYEVPQVTTSSNGAGTTSGIVISGSAGGNSIKITVPIEITVSVGGAASGATVGGVAPVAAPGGAATVTADLPLIDKPTIEQVEAAVAMAQALVGRRDDVVAIHAGYRFEDGLITKQRAVVIAVENKQSLATLGDRGMLPLPPQIGGIRVDVTNATLSDVLAREGMTEAAVPRGHNYKKREKPEFALKPVKERMKAILHSGPDSGWPQLKAFLSKTRRRLTVGMFEYTAPHVVEAGLKAIRGASEEMLLVVQKGQTIGEGTKAQDIPDEETVRQFRAAKGDKFKSVWASIRFKDGLNPVNPNGIFDSSYHIKVAVRDGKAIWLSSGSWQSSNQPNHDPIADGDQVPALINTYNREWHAIIEQEGLAALFEAHLRQDFEDAVASPMPEAALAAPDTYVWVPEEYFAASPEAAGTRPRYFEPLVLDRVIDVQPILSPDNYLERVLDLLAGAERSIFFQNQSLKIRKSRPEGYDRLLRTLRDKQQAGLDVRIIFRPFQDIRTDLEAIQEFGFDVGRVKLDNKCHTKGIVVDSRAVLLGSQNWTNGGTSYNRDASLIFSDRQIAEFYEQIFLYDWARATPARINEDVPAPRIVRPEEGVPPAGMVKVRLADLELE